MDVREFAWVSNEGKALRAVANLKKAGKEITEETIKAEYLKYGGLCIGDPSTQLGVEEGDITFPVLTPEEKEEVIAKSEKKGKKTR